MGIVAVGHDRDWLEVRFEGGATQRYPGTWLRDNITTGRHRYAGQRTFDINSLPELTIAGASLDADTVAVTFAPEGLDATFYAAWFRLHGSKPPLATPSEMVSVRMPIQASSSSLDMTRNRSEGVAERLQTGIGFSHRPDRTRRPWRACRRGRRPWRARRSGLACGRSPRRLRPG